MPIGFTVPFARTTGSTGYFYATTTDLQAARNDVKSLLLTNWGERPMRYELGCNLKEFLFEQRDADTSVRIDERIRSQVSKWVPFVSLDDLQIDFPTEHTIRISMKYSLIGRPDSVDTISVEVSR
jgi:phage baseplate assembly protein W